MFILAGAACLSGFVLLRGDFLIDLARNPIVTEFSDHVGVVHFLKFASDDLLVSAGIDRTVRTWDIERRKELGSGVILNSRATDVFANSSASRLLTVDDAGGVNLWGAPRSTPLATFGEQGNRDELLATLSNDGRFLAVSNAEDELKMWALPGSLNEGLLDEAIARFEPLYVDQSICRAFGISCEGGL